MKNIRYTILFLFLASFSLAQNTTTITGTITDADSQAWLFGSWNATLVNPVGGTAVYADGSGKVPLNQHGTLSSAGAFQSATLPNNTKILPVGTMWRFSFCPVATSPCPTTSAITISGSTLNVGSKFVMPAPRTNASNPDGTAIPLVWAYNSAEVINAINGSGWFNTSTNICNVWNGQPGAGTWTPFCNGGTSSGCTIGGTPITSGVIYWDGSGCQSDPYLLDTATAAAGNGNLQYTGNGIKATTSLGGAYEFDCTTSTGGLDPSPPCAFAVALLLHPGVDESNGAGIGLSTEDDSIGSNHTSNIVVAAEADSASDHSANVTLAGRGSGNNSANITISAESTDHSANSGDITITATNSHTGDGAINMTSSGSSFYIAGAELDVIAGTHLLVASNDITNPASNTAVLCVDVNGNMTTTACAKPTLVLVMPVAALAANTCTTPATATLVGVTTSSGFKTAFTSNPNAVVGWGAVSGLFLTAWPTAPDTFQWSECNGTSSSITPGPISINVSY